MTPIIQPGMHPDAEKLAAFAEQSLTPATRDQIFAHMATCSRCREIIFLAQKAIEDEQSEAAGVPAIASNKRRISWFNGWSWAWLATGGFAIFLGIAVVQNTRDAATRTHMDARMSQSEPLRDSATTVVARPSISNSESKQTPSAKPSELRDRTLPRADEDVAQFDQKKSMEQKDLPPAGAPPPILVNPGVAGESIHGTTAARAKTPSLGGPMAANQFEQQNTAPQQSADKQMQNDRKNEANSPVGSDVAITGTSESVTVQPQSPAPSALQAKPSNSRATLDNRQTAPVNEVRLHRAANLALPTSLQTLSTVSMAGRTIALDTAGALFLSEDGGMHWQSIPAQWTGRAVLLRTLPSKTQQTATAGVQATWFELVNDKLQTWVSIDGKTWTVQPLPLK